RRERLASVVMVEQVRERSREHALDARDAIAARVQATQGGERRQACTDRGAVTIMDILHTRGLERAPAVERAAGQSLVGGDDMAAARQPFRVTSRQLR